MTIQIHPLDDLRDALLRATDFAEVMSRFQDRYGCDRQFLALGQLVDPGWLHPLLERIGQQIFGPDTRASHVCLKRLPEQRFVHGALRLAGRPAVLILFEEAAVGLLAVILGQGRGMHYVRFSMAAVLEPDPECN